MVPAASPALQLAAGRSIPTRMELCGTAASSMRAVFMVLQLGESPAALGKHPADAYGLPTSLTAFGVFLGSSQFAIVSREGW